jgi:hypothetical protein
VTLDEQLDQLTDNLEHTEFQEGETTIRPDEGQALDAFQADVRRLRGYAAQGYVEIRSEKRESSSGDRHIVRVRIRMGPEGVAWRKELRSE